MQLETQRLILRPPSMLDAPRIRELAGDYEVAKGTLNIPHPYPEGAAEAFIDGVRSAWEKLSDCSFAAIRKADQALVGMIGLHMQEEHKRAELGYWIGVAYWKQGYATEAARCVLDWGFQTLGLNRIHAHHFAGNPASGRVMQKIGMKYEGVLRQHLFRFGEAHDVVCYAILRSEWETMQSTGKGDSR